MNAKIGRSSARRFRTVAPLAAFSAASVALLMATSGTLAAWTDDEYVSATAGVMVAGDCGTSTLFQTESAARQVSGFLDGQDLDTMAAVQGIRLMNNGGVLTVEPATAVQVDPVTYTANLQVGALGSQLLSASVGLNQPAGSAGAYTQWTRARASGQAAGAAGLVSDQSGAIDGTGTAAGSSSIPTTASVNLASFIPSAQAAMTLDVGAVASSSELDACVLNAGWPALSPNPITTRNYGIAGLRLNLAAEAIRPMTSSVGEILDSAALNLAALAAPGGSMTAGIDAGLEGLVSGSGLVGAASTRVGFGIPDLTAAKQLLGSTLTDGVVTIDLASSRMFFDLGELASGSAGLNGRPANSQVVVDEAAAQDLAQRTSALLGAWEADVTSEVKKALDGTAFTMDSSILMTLDGVPVAETTLRYNATIGALQSAPAPTMSTKVLQLESGLLDSTTASLVGVANSALLSGTGAVVSAALHEALFAPGGLVPVTQTSIESSVLPVVEESRAALDPLVNTLSLTVNVQPDQPGAPAAGAAAGMAADGQFKVSALRVAAVGSSAELYFATASAGPVFYLPPAAG